MTTDKAFNRVVLARMAKTGERYAAARRSLIDADTDIPTSALTVETAAGRTTYRLRGGVHPETATLANVLANQGVVSGLTGELPGSSSGRSPSVALVLGLFTRFASVPAR